MMGDSRKLAYTELLQLLGTERSHQPAEWCDSAVYVRLKRGGLRSDGHTWKAVRKLDSPVPFFIVLSLALARPSRFPHTPPSTAVPLAPDYLAPRHRATDYWTWLGSKA
jgi:hypothetical protein